MIRSGKSFRPAATQFSMHDRQAREANVTPCSRKDEQLKFILPVASQQQCSITGRILAAMRANLPRFRRIFLFSL
jgi:hypothetical protein